MFVPMMKFSFVTLEQNPEEIEHKKTNLGIFLLAQLNFSIC